MPNNSDSDGGGIGMGEAGTLVQRMIELFDKGDVEGSVACFTSDGTFANPVGTFSGHDEIRELFGVFTSAFDGIRHTTHTAYWDLAAFMQQLGVMSEPAGATA